jgi:hypothetical protein
MKDFRSPRSSRSPGSMGGLYFELNFSTAPSAWFIVQ